MVVTMVAGCGHGAGSASGPAFAPMPRTPEAAVVNFYRPDKLAWSELTITVGAIPVREADVDSSLRKLADSWQRGKESATFGQLLRAFAKEAGRAQERETFAASEAQPGSESAKPECWALANNGYFSLLVKSGDGLVVAYNSGSAVKIESLEIDLGVEYFYKLEPVDWKSGFETELTRVERSQALVDIVDSRGVDQCTGRI